MVKKVYIDLPDSTLKDMLRVAKKRFTGIRGLSSKKRRIRDKKIKEVMTIIIEEYLTERLKND